MSNKCKCKRSLQEKDTRQNEGTSHHHEWLRKSIACPVGKGVALEQSRVLCADGHIFVVSSTHLEAAVAAGAIGIDTIGTSWNSDVESVQSITGVSYATLLHSVVELCLDPSALIAVIGILTVSTANIVPRRVFAWVDAHYWTGTFCLIGRIIAESSITVISIEVVVAFLDWDSIILSNLAGITTLTDLIVISISSNSKTIGWWTGDSAGLTCHSYIYGWGAG